MTCACGEHARHVVATRQTFDGLTVQLWSDGSFGSRFSTIKGLPFRPRKNVAMEALWRFMDQVELLESDELGQAFEAATRPPLAAQAPKYCPVWEVTAADWRGVVTERRASLPRLMFPGGYVIFDEPGRRPRYSLWYEKVVQDGFYSSGAGPEERRMPCLVEVSRFVRLSDLFAHLAAEKSLNRGVA